MLSPDLTATEHDVVEAVRRELNSKPHEGLEIGTAGTFFTTGRYCKHIRVTTGVQITVYLLLPLKNIALSVVSLSFLQRNDQHAQSVMLHSSTSPSLSPPLPHPTNTPRLLLLL